MDKNTFYKIVAKVLAGEASAAEKKLLAKYIENEEYKGLFYWLKKEWNNIPTPSTGQFSYVKGLEKLQQKIKEEENRPLIIKPKTVVFRRRFFQATAAIILLFLAAKIIIPQFNPKPGIVEFAENSGQPVIEGNTKVILHDKSEIEVETNESEIDYTSREGKLIIDEKPVEREIDKSALAYNTVIVPYGKKSKVILADNSEVWLNSGSKLIYPAKFGKKTREVFLEGEALFDISHNKEQSFRVITAGIEVKVLGTVFNVSAYMDDAVTSTVLESGSVEISYKSTVLSRKSKLKIVPGTLAEYNVNSKSITQKQVDTQYYTSWHKGILIYQNEPLGNIVKKLSRYYNKTITLGNENLANETFSGKLDLKEDVKKVLGTIAFVASLKIESNNNELIIKN